LPTVQLVTTLQDGLDFSPNTLKLCLILVLQMLVFMEVYELNISYV